MKKSEILFGLARIPIDFGMTVLAFLVAYRMRQVRDFIPGIELPVDPLSFVPIEEYLEFAGAAGGLLVLLFAFNKMYRLRTTTRLGKEIVQVVYLASVWLMLIIAYYFVTRQLFFSRLVLAYGWFLTILFVSMGRIVIRWLQNWLCHYGIGTHRILFIGANTLTQRIADAFKTKPSYAVIGYLTTPGSRKKLDKLKDMGALKNLEIIVRRQHIEEIIQTQSDLSEAHAQNIIDFCREHHIQYQFVPDVLQVHRTQADVFNISGLPLISLRTTPLDGWGKVNKRIFDMVGSGILLILLSPLFLLIAVGIKIDSRGPVLFTRKDDGARVKRVGLQGKLFNFYKFRTMKDKTDSLRYTALAERDHRKGSPLVKIKNDPRVTRFGRILRRLSLDELPQLWSVLVGTMSLVGPRPHLPEEVAKYQKHHKFLLSIKPGVTGLSQVNGRSDLDFEKEVELDTYYIENWSLLLDLKVLARTLFVVLGGKGAD